MTSRALTLYGTFLRELLHRLRHDLARELVVLTASSVLFATFFYIFNDFLNVEVASLSTVMRDKIAWALAGLAWTVGAAAAGHAVRVERLRDQSLSRTARALGEEPATVTQFLILRTLTVVGALHAATWILTQTVLVQPSAAEITLIESLMIVLTLATGFAGAAPSVARQASVVSGRLAPVGGLGDQENPVATLTAWRWTQLTRRHRLTRLTLSVAFLLILLLAVATARGAPPFAGFTMALAAGYVAALALAFLLADDLPNVWTERGIGVTHDQFTRAYERLGVRIGLGFGGVAGILYGLARLTAAHAPAATTVEAARIVVIVALPAVMTPWLMLQIEGRRAGVNAILILIATLFVGTAVYANWLSLLLPLLLRYYALQSQAGRFYRA